MASLTWLPTAVDDSSGAPRAGAGDRHRRVVHPDRLPFWRAVFGYVVGARPIAEGNDEAIVVDPAGEGPTVWFQQLDWAGERLGLAFIPPGAPWRNGYVESFTGQVREECLNINIISSLAQARGEHRLEGRLKPPPALQLARLPSPSGVPCRLHPPMNDSHQESIRSRGPAVPALSSGTGPGSEAVAVSKGGAARGRGSVRGVSCDDAFPVHSPHLPVALDSGGIVKLLLTSGGVRNPTIIDALVGLLGKPTAEATALCIPTAQWGHPMCGPVSARGFVSGLPPWGGMTSMEWKSLGLLELSALPSIGEERWVPWVREADVLLVDGGDATFLCHWMHESGLADVLPSLPDTVWVGVSAGSMAMTPRIGADFVKWPSAEDDRTLGVVDFSIFPHLDVFPTNTLAEAERWATEIGGPAYAIDDQTAIKVADGNVEVVSEGHWKQFP
jgi:dipeptidase E